MDNASGPRMEGVVHLPFFGPVGVPSPRCTTACVRTRRSPTGHRKSSEPSTSPLRPELATVKTLPQGSTPEWRKEGAQLITSKTSPITGKPYGNNTYELAQLIRMSICGWDYPRMGEPK